MPKFVVVFYGRFQPPHRGHKAVYDKLVQNFGRDSVYIGTSNKTDGDKSPLSFENKKRLFSKLGVPSDKIIQTRQNYNVGEISKTLNIDFEDMIFVAAVGQKDASRLGGNFYTKLTTKDPKKLQTSDEKGYFWIIPNIKLGGNILSATDVRNILRQPKISPEDMKKLVQMTGYKPSDIKQMKRLFEHAHRKQWWHMLLEGGASGHMSHPFEDLSMKFSELKNIINLAFQGKLELASEGPITEKVDGQNLWASVINGQVRYARNKGQLKNFGRNSMTTADIDKKWKDNPDVRTAFMRAATTLDKGLGSLSKSDQKAIFNNGQNWVNFELIAHENPNVINYDSDVIIFHNIQMVDETGSKVGMDSKATTKLFKIFTDAEKSAKLNMRIQPPQIVKVDRDITIDFKKDLKQFISGIDSFAKNGSAKDGDTIGKAIENLWSKELTQLEKKHTMDIPKQLRKKLINRLTYGDKSYRITSLPKDLPDAAFIDDIKELDRNAVQTNKAFLRPLEILILRFGVVLLKNIDTFVAGNPDQSVADLRKAIAQQISTIRSSKNVEDINKMMGTLEKVESLGGFSDLVPSEGIVFRYNGKLYKLTGLFAPVNQLMGIGRFGR